jgi:hypothetical protein
MVRYLLVANQTLGGANLDEVLRQRISEGDAEFVVLVPATAPRFETALWMPADPMFTLPPIIEDDEEAAIEEAQERSQRRLDTIVSRIRQLGGRATGHVGLHDPVEAIAALSDREEFDAVIVSTLPSGISRWVKMDLPSRIERFVDVPVVVVEAEEDPGRDA